LISVYVPRPGLTAIVGGVVGALASVPSLEGARLVAEKLALRPQPFTSEGAFVVAMVVGALLGMTLCLVMMHAARWIGRVVFASVMTPALGFCVHVQLVAHHAPTVPVVPLLLGAGIFGACVACVPPLGRRRFV
jgi:hypothetical protein